MKKVIKSLSVLFVVILAVSVFVFAADGEEEKTYIVYPKETVSLFSAEGEYPEYMVIGEEELNMLLEEAPEMIDWYEENISLELFGSVTYDPWDFKMIGASSSYAKNLFGEGITIGVIDTGVWKDHPDLQHLNIQGYDYGDDDEDFSDPVGHGTHVTGRIAAAINEIGVDSLAPKATVVMLKCMDENGEQLITTIDKAIRAAVDVYDCDVINMSLGTSEDSDTLRKAVQYAIDKEVIIVAAVGNYASSTLYYPAAYDGVIGVGAVDKEKNVWVNPNINIGELGAGSQVNESVFITAPGTDALSTFLDADDGVSIYAWANGTSCSAPLVTGAVALLKQANPDLTPAEIMDILAQSATDDVKGDGYDTAYGHGILNVASAIELALGKEVLAPENVTYSVTAENTNLNSAITVANYTPGNIGSHPLGASFTATAMPIYTAGDGTTYKFAYWANGNGTHVSGEAKYTFNAVSNFTLRAVYDKAASDESVTTEKKVEFWNGNGILLDTVTADEGTGRVAEAAIPTNPTMTGFSFTSNWLHEDESIFNVNDELEKTLTRVVAQFEDTTTQYSITFEDNTAKDTKTGKYGDTVEYTAGEGFDYWKLGDKTISYDAKIEIALWDEEKILTAVYDEENITAKPTVVLDTGADNASFLIYSVPDGYTIIDAGIVFGTEGSTPRVASFHSKASVKKLPEGGFGQFTAQPGEASHAVARGYLIYNDGTAIRVIYTD